MVASKVYYHLGSFEDSLTYALGAGELFDVNARNEYVDTTIGKAHFKKMLLCFKFVLYLQQNALIFTLNKDSKRPKESFLQEARALTPG